MLTVDKLNIYEQFEGNIDGWARAAQARSTSDMTDEDWYLIDELLLGLTAVNTGSASPSYSRALELKLLTSTDDQATRDRLHALARQRIPRGMA